MFVIMVVAGSRPVLEAIKALVATLARLIPVRTVVAQTWLCLAVVPLVAGAIAGGGLTVIANAPNPAGVALLKRGSSLHELPSDSRGRNACGRVTPH